MVISHKFQHNNYHLPIYQFIQVNFKLQSPQVKIDFRFPIPDLRPELERKPWFKQALRDEKLLVICSDLKIVTSTAEQQCVLIQSRDTQLLYLDEIGKPPKPFIRTSQVSTLGRANDLDMPHVRITFLPVPLPAKNSVLHRVGSSAAMLNPTSVNKPGKLIKIVE